MPQTDHETRLLEGWAALMASEIPGLHYDPDPTAIYPAGVVGIYVDRWPEVAEGTVTLADYTVMDDVSENGDDVVGVQISLWHPDRGELRRIRGAARDLFHRRGRSMLGGVTMVLATRESGTNVGQDENGRQGRTENYHATISRYAN